MRYSRRAYLYIDVSRRGVSVVYAMRRIAGNRVEGAKPFSPQRSIHGPLSNIDSGASYRVTTVAVRGRGRSGIVPAIMAIGYRQSPVRVVQRVQRAYRRQSYRISDALALHRAGWANRPPPLACRCRQVVRPRGCARRRRRLWAFDFL